MVDSSKGITNLHVPSDVIIDASMPAAIRASGQMWGPDGKLHDTKAMIPDRSYAGIYQAVIDDCKTHGAFDVRTMGTVSNVGLMAQKAEEYGSHDKTFEIPSNGTVRVIDGGGQTLFEHARRSRRHLAHVPDEGSADPRLGQARGQPRAGDRPRGDLLARREPRLRPATSSPRRSSTCRTTTRPASTSASCRRSTAMRETLARVRAGLDTISVTGNVLRDYLTDLFPILELGTSAKMLSIVPLLAGGGLYETGAGGSAPKHVQQFLQENYLRWDSLGEFLALAVSIEDLGTQDRQREGARAGRGARPGQRPDPRERQVAAAQGRRDRQPRQPFLPGDVLGARAGRSDERTRDLQATFSADRRELEQNEADDRRGAERRAGHAGRHRRLLPPGSGADRAAMRPSATLQCRPGLDGSGGLVAVDLKRVLLPSA